MNQQETLQEYLMKLYELRDTFQTEYKSLHRRSQMHDTESIGDYYLRWRDKMKKEISRVEKMLTELLPPIQLRILNEVGIEAQSVENIRLHSVVISAEFVFNYQLSVPIMLIHI
jgi:hypothetical protein